MTQDNDHQDDSEEIARRRDAVIKRMLNTPPRPRQAPAKNLKERSVRKGRIHRSKSRP